jgi:GDP-mannose transporter
LFPFTPVGARPPSVVQVYYNNLLSIPPILLLMAVSDDYRRLSHQSALAMPAFQMVALLSGVIGFAIRYGG